MNSIVLRRFVYASRLNDRNITYTFQILDTPDRVLLLFV